MMMVREGASHTERRAYYARKRTRTVAQRITWEVLRESSAEKGMIIIANNTEPCPYAGPLNTLHPLLHLILTMTLSPSS